MADQISRMRTNYFRVTDIEGLSDILQKCEVDDGYGIHKFEKVVNGETLHAFGCESRIGGYYDPETEETDFISFAKDLQTVVASGDAIIIMETGYEKLNYVYGLAYIITSEKIESLDFTQMVLKKAIEVVGDPDYYTAMEY